MPKGQYSFVFDDLNANTADALQVWFVGNTNTCRGSDTKAGPGTGTGSTYRRTVVGNTVTVTYQLDYASDPNYAYGYNFNLVVWIQSAAGKWNQDGTISNFWIFGPLDEDNDRSDDFAVSGQAKAWMTASNGNGPAVIRNMQLGAYNGIGNLQEPEDLPTTTRFSWANEGAVAKVPIVSVRRYNTDPSDTSVAWYSPKLYHPLLGGRGTTGGVDSIGKYIKLPPGDNGACLVAYNTNRNQTAVLEFVCSSPHGLRSGDLVRFPLLFTGGRSILPIAGGDALPAISGTATIMNGSNTVTFSETQTFNNSQCVTFGADTTGAAYRLIANPSPKTGKVFSIAPAYGGTTSSTSSITRTAGVQINDTIVPCLVTSATTFVTWNITTYGVTSGTKIKRLSATTPIPIDPGVISLVGGSLTSYRYWAHVAAQFPGSILWLPTMPHMSDACLEAIADQMAPVMLPNSVFVAELGLEHWNTLHYPTYFYLAVYGNLLLYLDPLTSIDDYYKTTSAPSVLGQDKVNVLISAHQWDVLQARFDTYKKGIQVYRVLGSQFAGPNRAANQIKFACGPTKSPAGGLQKKVAISGIAVAPYATGPAATDTTWTDACASTRGNWPAAAINEWYRHWLKYSGKQRACYEADAKAIDYYVANGGPGFVVGQTGGKPGLIAYEASIQKIDPAYAAALQHDLWYHPSFAFTYDAFLQSMQDGSPYVPHSGIDLCCTFAVLAGWRGRSNQQLWSLVTRSGQSGGDGTKNLFTTRQGGLPGDGKCYDYPNESVQLPVFQQWLAR